MQAAIVLAKRGHYVDLYEKNQLGGQFNLASLPPNKENLKNLVDYLKMEVFENSPHLIKVNAMEVNANDLLIKDYKAIISATGAIPKIPPIKGLREYYWTEFLTSAQLPENQKVLVIGGGLIGIEMASKLVDSNNQVVIVEMLSEMAQGMEMMEKTFTLKKLAQHNTELITAHQVMEIHGTDVVIEGPEGRRILEGIEKIVLAAGMQSYRPIAETEGLKIVYIGDALKVGKAQDAIHQAWDIASKL